MTIILSHFLYRTYIYDFRVLLFLGSADVWPKTEIMIVNYVSSVAAIVVALKRTFGISIAVSRVGESSGLNARCCRWR